MSQALFHNFWLYNNIINSKSDFTSHVILIAKISIILVSVIWLILLCFLMATFHLVEFIFVALSVVIVIGLLGAFFWTLNKLAKNISEIGNLPSIEQLLDADNKDSSVNTVTLAGMTMALRLIKNKHGEYEISVGFPVPFNEFFVRPTISATKTGKFALEDVEFIDMKSNEELFRIRKEKYEWWLGSPLQWHKLFKFEIARNIKAIHIQLELNCAKGVTYVHYDDILVDKLNKLDLVDRLELFPTRFSEVFVEALHGPAKKAEDGFV